MRLILAFILLVFLFYGEPDIFDALRNVIINNLENLK